jgi:hypothetical protein
MLIPSPRLFSTVFALLVGALASTGCDGVDDGDLGLLEKADEIEEIEVLPVVPEELMLAAPAPEPTNATFTNLSVSNYYLNDSVGAGELKYYRFYMNQYNTYTVTLAPGYSNQDVDLFTSNSEAISPTNYQCRPLLGKGVIETCLFQAPKSGWNYVMVRGTTAANFALRVTSP